MQPYVFSSTVLNETVLSQSEGVFGMPVKNVYN